MKNLLKPLFIGFKAVLSKTSYLLLLGFVAFLISCGDSAPKPQENNNKPDNPPTTVNPEPTKPAPADNRSIDPSNYFGEIKEGMTKEDVVKIYGAENFVEESVYVGEGQEMQGAYIFKDKPDQVRLIWNPENPKELMEISTSNQKSTWKTLSGVHVGMTLTELAKINGKPITFAGFAWDYAGAVFNYNGGKLSEDLHLVLDMESGQYPEAFVGDIECSSDAEGLDTDAVKVVEMSISFLQE